MTHRLQHPQVLLHPALLPWLERVCAHLGLHVCASAYLADLCAQAHTQVLLGIEGERPVALLVTQLPTPLMLQPTILLGYNDGSKAIGAEMMREAARWLRTEGFDRFLAMNRSGRSDAAYERGLRPHGMVIERVTTFLVELNKEETDEVRCEDRNLGGVHAA
jgi:acetolactate synthase regulatory subunit